jgi:ABC-2 type transport system ATP-binding protein
MVGSMIETRDLAKSFGDFRAVDGLNISVKPGQVLALLGQNGAGKTTTVRMLSALLSPSRGSARVSGYDVVSQASRVRASVGVLTEQHGLYVRMTASEYLDFFARLHRLGAREGADRIAFLLEYFGLSAAASRRIGEFSKGMRQKLALARALMHDPPVLLLDEPTSAMDPESARLVRDEIARLRSAKRAIVICTHNLAEAEELADVVAIIHRGRILLTGTLPELRQRVLGAAEYEARFSAAWIKDPVLPGGVLLTRRDEVAMRFRVDNPESSNPLLMRELALQDAPVVAFQEVPRTLEDVYLKVMAGAQADQDGPELYA